MSNQNNLEQNITLNPLDITKDKIKNLDFSSIDEKVFKELLDNPQTVEDIFNSIVKSLESTSSVEKKGIDLVSDLNSLNSIDKVFSWLESKFTPTQKQTLQVKIETLKALILNQRRFLSNSGLNSNQDVSLSPNVSTFNNSLSNLTVDTFDQTMKQFSLPNIDAATKDLYSKSLVEHVLKSNNQDIFNKFLTYISPTSLIYLGSSQSVQKENYTKISNSPFINQLTDQQKKSLTDVLGSILKKPNLTESIKVGIDGLVKQFGGLILNVLSLFGGKGAIRNFCNVFKLDYYKHFESLEKLYADTYKLTDLQKNALGAVYSDVSDKIKANDDMFSGTGESGIDLDKIKNYYIESWQNNISLMDPGLVSNAVKKAGLTIPNLIVEDGISYGEKKYKVNDQITIESKDKATILKTLFEDKSLDVAYRSFIRSNPQGDRETAESIYGKTKSTYAERLWATKKPQNIADKVVAMGVFLMAGSKDIKYVFSENTLPYEKDRKEESGIDKMEQEWKKRFDKYGKDPLKQFSSTTDVSKIPDSQQKNYENYQKSLSSDFKELLSPGSKDIDVVFNSPLKETFKSFIINHMSNYLKSMKSVGQVDPKKIDSLLLTFDQITKGKSQNVSLNDGIVELSTSLENKTIVFKSSELTRLLPVSEKESQKTESKK